MAFPKAILLEVNKKREMLCPVEDEFKLLEIFFNDDKEITQELFPEWYIHGAYQISTSDIEDNLTTLRMLTI